MWLADLAAHGLIRGSFVPDAQIRELKDLVRTRTTLAQLRVVEVQRLEKTLESTALKLSVVINDLTGVSGRRMLEALVAGERDPVALAALGDGRLKASKAELAEALTGRFSDHHAFLVQLHLDLIDAFTSRIEAITARIELMFAPTEDTRPGQVRLRQARELLVTIPGISTTAAEQILAEIGTDMTVFPTAGHLASWAGVAPGANESAGKVKSATCRPGNRYLKRTLGIAAMSVARSKNTFLSARYKRIMARRGHRRALVAIARTLLETCWHLLVNRQPYRDLGSDYYTRRRPGTAIKHALDRLHEAGCQIHTTDGGILLTFN